MTATSTATGGVVLAEHDAVEGPLPFNKLCNLGDFAHPDLEPYLVETMPELRALYGTDWPARSERVQRKMWEIAMALRTFDHFGILNDEAELLGVGAGQERTVFLLTNHVKRVFATDLYCAAGAWVDDASEAMLRDPSELSPVPFNQRRLVVQHMNGCELQYEDDSFDGIFSSSSIEHFGELEDVHRSAREMYRVLKPGGILSVSTEFRLVGPPPGIPGALLFDALELDAVLIGDLDWALVDPMDFTVSDATIEGAQSFPEIVRLHQAGQPTPPHIVLHNDPYMWTSVHVALRKPLPADR